MIPRLRETTNILYSTCFSVSTDMRMNFVKSDIRENEENNKRGSLDGIRSTQRQHRDRLLIVIEPHHHPPVARISRANCRINISPPRGRLSGIATRANERATVKVSRTPSGFASSRAAAPASDSPADYSEKRKCLSNVLLIPACPDDHPAV